MSFGAKSRKSRFYRQTVFEGNPFKQYVDAEKCCTECLSKGDKVTLQRFKDPTISVKMACLKHNGKNINIWVWVKKTKSYVRCLY